MNRPATIVDSHVHLWNPAVLHLAWLEALPELNRARLPEDFAHASAAANVSKMIFIECGGEPAQAIVEVDWVSALAKAEKRLCGIVAQAPLERGAEVREHLMQLARRPLVKGVRRLLQGEYDAEFCLRPEFVAGVKLLAVFDFTFDVCLRSEQLPAVTELVRRVPEVEFVFDHLGKPPVKAAQIEPWATQLKTLAGLPNVSCKISGLTTEADWQHWRVEDLKPYFEVALEAFGEERVLFGGDWPVCNLATDYGRWVETVVQLSESLTESGQRKLFQTNAERIYRI
jgi:L-fuconolactonase